MFKSVMDGPKVEFATQIPDWTRNEHLSLADIIFSVLKLLDPNEKKNFSDI